MLITIIIIIFHYNVDSNVHYNVSYKVDYNFHHNPDDNLIRVVKTLFFWKNCSQNMETTIIAHPICIDHSQNSLVHAHHTQKPHCLLHTLFIVGRGLYYSCGVIQRPKKLVVLAAMHGDANKYVSLVVHAICMWQSASSGVVSHPRTSSLPIAHLGWQVVKKIVRRIETSLAN